MIFGEGGSIGLHAHPGTLVMTVETGSFGFTYMGDGDGDAEPGGYRPTRPANP